MADKGAVQESTWVDRRTSGCGDPDDSAGCGRRKIEMWLRLVGRSGGERDRTSWAASSCTAAAALVDDSTTGIIHGDPAIYL